MADEKGVTPAVQHDLLPYSFGVFCEGNMLPCLLRSPDMLSLLECTVRSVSSHRGGRKKSIYTLMHEEQAHFLFM
jgi:hypothetical protein